MKIQEYDTVFDSKLTVWHLHHSSPLSGVDFSNFIPLAIDGIVYDIDSVHLAIQ